MSLTVKHIAELAGVSTATVSRVLNNDPRIAEKTRERVRACIERTGYRPNTVARSLKLNRTHTIGLIVPELANYFFMTIAEGIEAKLKAKGYSMIICSSNESVEEEEERIKLLIEKCVDGVIIIPASSKGSHFRAFVQAEIPVVIADRQVEDFETDTVLVDNSDGSFQAVKSLIEAGARRIAFIGGDLSLSSARERYEGFLKALNESKIPGDERIIKFGDFHVKSGYRLMKELMEQDDPPEYVFISNYFMHVGATKYLAEQALDLRKRGRNITIASFDDMELSPILIFSSITVEQPVEEIGKTAAAILLARIQKEGEKVSPMVTPRIVRLPTTIHRKEALKLG